MAQPPDLPGLRLVRQLNDDVRGDADVYLAEALGAPDGDDDNPPRKVAVKIYRQPVPTDRQRRRFVDEVASLRSVSGRDHLVEVFDGGVTSDGTAYVVMEHCPDGSLDDHLATVGRLTPDEARSVGLKIADALVEARRHGLARSAVNPTNVLLNASGEPVLANFGTAALGTSESGPAADDGGDVYALGAMIYSLINGSTTQARPAFGIDGDDTPGAGGGLDGLPAGSGLDGLAPAFAAVLDRALAPDPQRRYRDVGELRAALVAVDTTAAPTGAPVDPGRPGVPGPPGVSDPAGVPGPAGDSGPIEVRGLGQSAPERGPAMVLALGWMLVMAVAAPVVLRPSWWLAAGAGAGVTALVSAYRRKLAASAAGVLVSLAATALAAGFITGEQPDGVRWLWPLAAAALLVAACIATARWRAQVARVHRQLTRPGAPRIYRPRQADLPSLVPLTRLPGVRIFRLGGEADYAVVAGRRVALVSFKTWPAASYRYDVNQGALLRDGRRYPAWDVDAGAALSSARAWEDRLPSGTRVKAFLVVRRQGGGHGQAAMPTVPDTLVVLASPATLPDLLAAYLRAEGETVDVAVCGPLLAAATQSA